MPAFLVRYATPLITGLFAVSLISGVALYFHVAQGSFHAMHEQLSIVLIAPFVLHLWRNWRGMTTYFSKPAFAIALGVCFVAALGFAAVSLGAGGRGGPPQFALVHTLSRATPAELSSALGIDAARLVAALKSSGFENVAADRPLADAGKSDAELAIALSAAAATR